MPSGSTLSNLDIVRRIFGSGFRISRWYIPGHDGIDLPAKVGTPIRAVAAGRVSYARDARTDPNPRANWAEGGGNVVNIDIGSSQTTQYAHLQDIRVKAGEFVQRGQIIGTVGATGGLPNSPGANFGAGGAHLHFGLWDHKSNTMVNPTRLLSAAAQGWTTAVPVGDTDKAAGFVAILSRLGIPTDPAHRITHDEAIAIAKEYGVSGALAESVTKTYEGTTVGEWIAKMQTGEATTVGADPLRDIATAAGGVATFFTLLSDPANWVRILALFAGAGLFAFGAFGIAKGTSAVRA